MSLHGRHSFHHLVSPLAAEPLMMKCWLHSRLRPEQEEEEEGVEWSGESNLKDCQLSVFWLWRWPVSALQCIQRAAELASAHCMHLGCCRPGPGARCTDGPACAGWHLYPACSDCSPSSPPRLQFCVSWPRSPGWRPRCARPLQTRCSLDPRLQRPGAGPLGCCRHWVADTVSD